MDMIDIMFDMKDFMVDINITDIIELMVTVDMDIINIDREWSPLDPHLILLQHGVTHRLPE